MFLFKFLIFEFDLASIFSLFVGISMGLIFAAVIYVLIVITNIRPKKHIVKAKAQDFTPDKVELMIADAQKIFNDKTLQGDLSTMEHCKNVSFALVQDIARNFFPDSKRPLFELTVDEVLMLSVYISKRIDEMLDHSGTRLFKKIKISTVIGLSDVKKTVDESSLMKATKKYKLIEAVKVVKDAINVVNPIYWARKVVISRTLNYAIQKICTLVIEVTGEETYKIYSKNVFDKSIDFQKDHSNTANAISNDLKEISTEEIDNFDLTELEG